MASPEVASAKSLGRRKSILWRKKTCSNFQAFLWSRGGMLTSSGFSMFLFGGNGPRPTDSKELHKSPQPNAFSALFIFTITYWLQSYAIVIACIIGALFIPLCRRNAIRYPWPSPWTTSPTLRPVHPSPSSQRQSSRLPWAQNWAMLWLLSQKMVKDAWLPCLPPLSTSQKIWQTDPPNMQKQQTVELWDMSAETWILRYKVWPDLLHIPLNSDSWGTTGPRPRLVHELLCSKAWEPSFDQWVPRQIRMAQ